MSSVLPFKQPKKRNGKRAKKSKAADYTLADLATLPIWVNWRDDKMPLNPRTGLPASSSDSTTWATLAEAQAQSDRIGIMFSAIEIKNKNGDVTAIKFSEPLPDRTRLIGVDEDTCRDPVTGKITPWAQAVVDKFDSYAEASVSGTGLHIIARADAKLVEALTSGNQFKREPNVKHGSSIEFYPFARYFTLTGKRIGEIENLRLVTKEDIEWLLVFGEIFKTGLFDHLDSVADVLAAFDVPTEDEPVADLADIESLDDLREALGHLPSDDRDRWYRAGFAIKRKFGEAGFAIWDEWSARSEKYQKNEIANEWKGLKPRAAGVGEKGGAVTIGSIYRWAMDAGWQPRRYVIRDGAFYLKHATKNGIEYIRLCNFTGEIAEIIERDDGRDRRRSFIVKSGNQQIEIPADEFDDMKWLTARWGPAKAIVAGQGMEAHVAAAIKERSNAATRTIYLHIGWREIDGAMVYLHGDGAVGTDGPVDGVQTHLEGRLADYRLPVVVGDIKKAVRASLSMIRLGPIGHVLLATTYAAPLIEFEPCPASVFLDGPTGSLKSTLSALSMAHWGKAWRDDYLPISWEATENAIEGNAFLAKDVVFVVDDFTPGDRAALDVQRLHRAADRVMRGAANRAGRNRMRPDGSLRPANYPRGLVMSSGEDTPKGQSLRARMVTQRIERDSIDMTELTRLQRLAAEGMLAEAMAAYVRYLAGIGRAALTTKLKDWLQSTSGIGGEHARTSINIAHLLLGPEMFVEFALSVGAIEEAEAADLRAKARDALSGLVAAQDEQQATENPALQFVELLSQALSAGRCHAAVRNVMTAPFGIEAACGWRRFGPEQTWRAQGDCVGYVEGDTFYLVKAVAYAAVEKLCRDQGRSLGLTSSTLGKLLHAAKLIDKPARADLTRFGKGRSDVARLFRGKVSDFIGNAPDYPQRLHHLLVAAEALNPPVHDWEMKKLTTAITQAANRKLRKNEDEEADERMSRV